VANVVKVIELVGSSPQGWDEAAQNAVQEAAKTIRNITGVEMTNMTAEVSNGRISEYRATLKIAFIVETSQMSS
jgi:dodecin